MEKGLGEEKIHVTENCKNKDERKIICVEKKGKEGMLERFQMTWE